MQNLDDKYSPNLAAWLRKQQRRGSREQHVWRDSDGAMWIGWKDEDLYLIGSRLNVVLCNGAKAETWAFPLHRIADLEQVEGFWESYDRIGRCAIDPAHKAHFISREARYAECGDQRTCKWCGAEFDRVRYTKTVQRERWDVRPNA